MSRSLDEKELENEQFSNLSGQEMPKIFPQYELGQSMRWNRFKDQAPQVIFDIISQLVFPCIKKMRGGKLPDLDAQGRILESEATEGNTEN